MNSSSSRHYHLSYEKVSSFERCPRRYFFSYLLRAPADFTPYYLYLGKIVHKCIAYIEETGREFEPYLLDLLMEFEFQNEQEIKKVYELSISLVLMWRYWKRQRISEEVKFVEKPFEIFTEKGILFKGRMDRVAYDSVRDEWIITEYKTGKSKVPQKNVAGNLQTGCYALGLTKIIQNIEKVRVELVYLRDSETREAYIDATKLGEFEKAIDDAYFRIINTNRYPGRKTWFCSVCRFSNRCEKTKDEYRHLIPYLKDLTESEEKEKRIEAIIQLVKAGDKNIIHALSYSVQHDKDPDVRKQAAYALGKLGDEWTLSFLVKDPPRGRFPDEARLALGLIADKCSGFARKIADNDS